MARLPTRDDLGAPPSARSNRIVARADLSGVGRAQANLGREIMAAGQIIAQHEDQTQQFETERRFQEFQFEQQKKLDESMRNVDPGQAAGFADQFTGQYRESAKEFFKTVPENLRAKYDNRLFSAEREFYGNAATFGRTEQKRSSIRGIEETQSNVYFPRASSGEPIDRVKRDYKSLLDTNPHLTPVEKDELFRKSFADIERAHVRGRLERGEDIDAIIRDIRGGAPDTDANPETRARPFAREGGSGAAPTGAANISTRLETGKDDPLEGVRNISKDSAGTKSYGNFGLNSGGSVQKFVAEYGDKFELTAKPGTPEFDTQWKNAAKAAPVELHAAEMQWHNKLTSGIRDRLVNAGVPEAMADDPRVQAYFADRSVQQGEGSIDGMEKHAKRIKVAADGADGDAVKFLTSITEADRKAIGSDFPTALRTGAYSERGHDTRLNGRLKMSLNVEGDEKLREMVGPNEGPYQHLTLGQRQELINAARSKKTASLEAEREQLKRMFDDDEASIRQTGQGAANYNLERAKLVLEPNQINRHLLNRQKAAMEWNAMHDLDVLSNDNLLKRLDAIAPKAGEKGYDMKSDVYQKVQKRVDDLREQRRSDAALSVDKLPEVAAAATTYRAAPDNPEAAQALVRARLDAQERVGIPENLRAPITNQEAKEIMAPTKGLEGKELFEVLREMHDKLDARYGPYAASVARRSVQTEVHSKELAEEIAGQLRRAFSGSPVNPNAIRRVEVLTEMERSQRAYSLEAGDAFAAYGLREAPRSSPRAADVRQQYGMPVQVQSIEEARRLPPGTSFYDPSGVLRMR